MPANTPISACWLNVSYDLGTFHSLVYSINPAIDINAAVFVNGWVYIDTAFPQLETSLHVQLLEGNYKAEHEYYFYPLVDFNNTVRFDWSEKAFVTTRFVFRGECITRPIFEKVPKIDTFPSDDVSKPLPTIIEPDMCLRSDEYLDSFEELWADVQVFLSQ